MEEFKGQLDAAEEEKVTKHIAELREIAARALGGDESLTADAVREKINATQQASLGLFQKVYEKRSAESTSQESSLTKVPKEKKGQVTVSRFCFRSHLHFLLLCAMSSLLAPPLRSPLSHSLASVSRIGYSVSFY